MHTKSKKLTWANANLQNSAERNALFQQEEKKASQRVKQAFDKLKAQGIVDEHGNLLSDELPEDMQQNSQCDFGG
jgi:hypothetical protein